MFTLSLKTVCYYFHDLFVDIYPLTLKIIEFYPRKLDIQKNITTFAIQ